MLSKTSKISTYSVITIAFVIIIFMFSSSSITAKAAQKIEFNANGTLIINDDGQFEASGATVASGQLDENTSIVANGDLEVVLQNRSEVTIYDIDVTNGDLLITGTGSLLLVGNVNGNGIRVDQDILIEAIVTLTDVSVFANGNIFITTNGVLSCKGTNTEERVNCSINAASNITNTGGKMFGFVYSQTGDITVTNGGLIESNQLTAYPVRAQKGNIYVDAATIRVTESSVDGVTVGYPGNGIDPYVISVTNGGYIYGYGDNAGIGAGILKVDNSIVEGESRRIGASGDNGIEVTNGGRVIGSILELDPDEQNYGVIAWDGDILVSGGGSIKGTGQFGVLTYKNSINANAGNITGYGELYGVLATEDIIVSNGGLIKGEASNRGETPKGIRARRSIFANRGTLEGYANYYGIVAANSIFAESNSMIKGIADVRIDQGASVFSPLIEATKSSTVFEYYYGDIVSIGNEEPVNPYFSSTNMLDFSHFDWTVNKGAIETKENGIVALISDKDVTVQARRVYTAGEDEVVKLSSEGDNEHIIQLRANLFGRNSEIPEVPEVPTNPEVPQIPDNTENPEIPVEVPDQDQNNVPATGDYHMVVFYFIGLLITLGLIIFNYNIYKKSKNHIKR